MERLYRILRGTKALSVYVGKLFRLRIVVLKGTSGFAHVGVVKPAFYLDAIRLQRDTTHLGALMAHLKFSAIREVLWFAIADI